MGVCGTSRPLAMPYIPPYRCTWKPSNSVSRPPMCFCMDMIHLCTAKDGSDARMLEIDVPQNCTISWP